MRRDDITYMYVVTIKVMLDNHNNENDILGYHNSTLAYTLITQRLVTGDYKHAVLEEMAAFSLSSSLSLPNGGTFLLILRATSPWAEALPMRLMTSWCLESITLIPLMWVISSPICNRPSRSAAPPGTINPTVACGRHGD